MNTKERILNSARKLFTDYGYKKVSMDEIASNAGVTKKTVYSYFKDKEELVKYFINEQITQMKNITDKIDAKDISFVEKINEMIITLLHYRKNTKFIINLAKEAEALPKGKAKEFLEVLNESMQKEIKEKLTSAIKDGYVKDCDVEITAFIIYKIYTALVFEWDGPIEQEKASKNIMEILKSGLIK